MIEGLHLLNEGRERGREARGLYKLARGQVEELRFGGSPELSIR